jgi:hypothetical protein
MPCRVPLQKRSLLAQALSVSAESTSARRLYERVWFEPYGREPAAIKLDDRSIDAELLTLRLHGKMVHNVDSNGYTKAGTGTLPVPSQSRGLGMVEDLQSRSVGIAVAPGTTALPMSR